MEDHSENRNRQQLIERLVELYGALGRLLSEEKTALECLDLEGIQEIAFSKQKLLDVIGSCERAYVEAVGQVNDQSKIVLVSLVKLAREANAENLDLVHVSLQRIEILKGNIVQNLSPNSNMYSNKGSVVVRNEPTQLSQKV